MSTPRATATATAEPGVRLKDDPPLAKADRSDGGWFVVENRLVDEYLRQIGPNGLAVYLMICREHDRAAYPTMMELRHQTRLSLSSVGHALKALVSFGLLNKHDVACIRGAE